MHYITFCLKDATEICLNFVRCFKCFVNILYFHLLIFYYKKLNKEYLFTENAKKTIINFNSFLVQRAVKPFY